MRKISVAFMSILILFGLVACDDSDNESEINVYEDVKNILISDLEEQGENNLTLPEENKIDIEDLGNDSYEVYGELYYKDGNPESKFTMKLEYTGDSIDYEWETKPINTTENNDSSDDQEDSSKEEYSKLDILNQLAALSIQTEEIYITDDLLVGETEEVNPGIYDLEITGGSGNITGSRSNVSSLHINWAAEAKGNNGGYPSQIRIILFEGDTLKFRNISKVKFNPVPEKIEPINELGIGEFVVGRDILPGDYKLSTNIELSKKHNNLGWDIRIYNDEEGKSRNQTFTAINNDVLVSLKEGEVISTSYTNTDHGSLSDDAKLIFIEE